MGCYSACNNYNYPSSKGAIALPLDELLTAEKQPEESAELVSLCHLRKGSCHV